MSYRRINMTMGMWMHLPFERVSMRSQRNLVKVQLIEEENDCDENVTVEVMLAKSLTLQDFSKIVRHSECKGQSVRSGVQLRREWDSWPRHRKDVCSTL